MNTRYWLTLSAMALVCIGLWSYNKPAQADVVYQPQDEGVRITCTAQTPSEVIAQCQEAMQILCPRGGTLSDPAEGNPDTLPRWLSLTVKCTPDPSI